MKKCNGYLIGVLGVVLLLTGCSTIEHRSDEIKRQPLPALCSDFTPQIRWCATDSSGVCNSSAQLKPALAAGTVVIADAKGRLIAYDRTSGAKLWEVQTGACIAAGPSATLSTVYVGTHEGNLLAYCLSDGSFLWKTALSGEILAAPTLAQNTVFVHALDSTITALSATDGHPIWRYGLSNPSIVLRHSSSPQAAHQHVVVGFANGRLLSFHALDGSIEWERELGDPKGRSDVARMADISADPVISRGIVYAVSYQGRLAALSLDTGQPLWERKISSYSGLTLSSKMLYISEADGSVRAVLAHSGDTMWRQPGLGGRRLTKPTLWQNILVVGDDEGYCHFICPKEGTFLGRIRIDSKGIDATPVVADENLLVLSRSGKLVSLCK
jgi:outer membrane protein assembly factor BamB